MTTNIAPTHPLIRIRDSASIQDAAKLMCDMSMGTLGVDNHEHEFIGLITERDLMWAMAQAKDPVETAVKDVVNDYPIVVHGPVSNIEAARRMRTAHLRHLIVRSRGELRIVSMRDLMNGFIGDHETVARPHTTSASELRRMFGDSFAGYYQG